MKGKLADSDARVNKERAERNAALLEKEQFRAHIHRLARALRREREKTASTARRELEQLRLEYVAKEQVSENHGEASRERSELVTTSAWRLLARFARNSLRSQEQNLTQPRPRRGLFWTATGMN